MAMLVCVLKLFDGGVKDLSLFSRFCMFLSCLLLGMEFGSETSDISIGLEAFDINVTVYLHFVILFLETEERS